MSKILAVVVAFLLAGCVTTAEPPLTLAERFERTALTDDRGHPMPGLVRWERPYLVRVQEIGKPLPVDIGPYLDTLSELSGLEVRQVALDDPSATVTIGYAPRQAILPYVRMLAEQHGYRYSPTGFSCFAIWEDGGKVVWIYIPSELPERKVRLCLAQEMAQILGLHGDMDGRTDTAFASGTGADHLTPTDKELIRLLYSPGLRNGMPRDEALAVVNGLLAERPVN